jgi:type 1 fimbriae regulatory protein FimB/type 1 fimbriae regulatory protein FimE
MVAFHHGLRVSELVGLRWEQIDFEGGSLHVRRLKQGTAATHPLPGRELRALRQLKRDSQSPFVFVSERGAPLTAAAVNRMLQRLGPDAHRN